jgi:hypothetical protein
MFETGLLLRRVHIKNIAIASAELPPFSGSIPGTAGTHCRTTVLKSDHERSVLSTIVGTRLRDFDSSWLVRLADALFGFGMR